MSDFANSPACIAYGILNMPSATPADPWFGARRGFVAAGTDGGAGIWTVSLDRDTADPIGAALGANSGGLFVTFGQLAMTGGVTAPAACSAEIVTASLGTATPQLIIRALDAGAMAVDIVVSIMLWRAFGT